MTRLRLKRLFLLSLVISLTACALVAIGALLLSQFNRTTQRILTTLVALGFHSGLAMSCAASLERRRRPRLSTAGLVAFGLNFAWMMVCVWWPTLLRPLYGSYGYDPDVVLFRSIGTTAALTATYALTIPCVDLARARRRASVAAAGLAVCATAFLMLLVCLWAPRAQSRLFGELTAVAWVLAITSAHVCLLGRVRSVPGLEWLRRGAVSSAWLLAGIVSFLILGDLLEEDAAPRVAGAAGVLDATLTICLVIMTKVRSVERIESLDSAPGRIHLQCPRCSAPQVLDAGASACGACGLRFRIEIEEPRCGRCGYLLWRLPERRCPECGTAF